MTHSEQMIDIMNNEKYLAMEKVEEMYQVLGPVEFLRWLVNSFPMLLIKEQDQMLAAYYVGVENGSALVNI